MVAQHPCLDLLRFAFRHLTELERTEGHADQPVHIKADRREHILHLAVLALPQRYGQPGIRALHAVEHRLDRAIGDAVHLDAVLQLLEDRWVHLAMHPHTVAAKPARRRQRQHARKATVIRQKQKTFGVDVEPPDGDHARQVLRQIVKDGGAPFRVAGRRHEAGRLVVKPQPRALALGQWLAIHDDAVLFGDIDRGRGQNLPIDHDAPGFDPLLGLAA